MEKKNKNTENNEEKDGTQKDTVALKSQTDKTFFCVGIGASAGGLEALEQFFKKMSPDSGLAFVVVQHLSPDYKSLMVELLSKHTLMKVYRAEDGMEIIPNCIYLIPPKKNMTVFHGKLFLTEQKNLNVINLPIDIFFRSLAEDYTEKSIGIILSGTGSDGTLGIRAIKGIGGMVMAQDDISAKFDGMPRSAIATGLVDYILSPDKMPEELLKFLKHPLTAKAEDKQELSSYENSLNKILSIIRNHTGVDFTYYKPNTIVRRLERRISINQINDYEDYVTFLDQSKKEVNILYKELLIGVTKFFRDTEGFDLLNQSIIPNIFEHKSKGEPIRLWSVGCSTGEEAYSLAIMLQEYMELTKNVHEIKIFATDLDKDSIEWGSTGFYPESIVTDVSVERLKKFFIKKDKGYQVKESIRKMVIFATHNIIKDPPFSRIDLISCRNMLIYLKPVMQKKVLSLFHFSLSKKGYLFLGSSESLGDLSKSFTVINNKWKIYQYREGYGPDNPGDFMLPNIKKSKKQTSFYENSITGDAIKTNRTSEITESIYNAIIEDFIPPSIVIDENFEIIHICKDVNRYVKLPTGKVSFDVFSLLRKEISTAVSIAIHKAMKEEKEITYNDFKIKDNNEVFRTNIRVKPALDNNRNRKFIFIFFEEKLVTEKDKETDKGSIEYDSNQQIKDLETELNYTKENLQATIEELGTSNEELQATNEELISSNEELQSTNEELQSVNEELYTVNSEYQNKIDVLTQLNNDINNLLKSTNIGTVFLDRSLKIRKFTPAVTTAINILEMDIGRPIHHISHNTLYNDFLGDVESVLRTLVPKEVEVQGKQQNWFLMRILPYRTLENAIDGVVITFFDITERKVFEEKLERESKLLISILDNSPIASTILDGQGSITYANQMAEEVLGLNRDEITQRNYNAPKWKITDIDGSSFPDSNLPFLVVKKTGKPVYDVQHNIQWPDGSSKTLSINASPVFNEKQQVEGVICTLLDITEKRALEEKIKREHELFYRILENSSNAKIMVNKDCKVTYANPIAIKLLELPPFNTGKPLFFNKLPLKSSHGNLGNKNITQATFKKKETVFNVPHKLMSQSPQKYNLLFLTSSPVFDKQGNVESAVVSIDDSRIVRNISTSLGRQLQYLGDRIADPLLTINGYGFITSWNKKAEELTSLSANNVMGEICYYYEENENKENTPLTEVIIQKNIAEIQSILIIFEKNKFIFPVKKIEILNHETDNSPYPLKDAVIYLKD